MRFTNYGRMKLTALLTDKACTILYRSLTRYVDNRYSTVNMTDLVVIDTALTIIVFVARAPDSIEIRFKNSHYNGYNIFCGAYLNIDGFIKRSYTFLI